MEVEFTVPLQELFSYRLIWLIMGLSLIAVALAVFVPFFLRYRNLRKNPDKKPAVRKLPRIAVPIARQKYLRQLARLENGLAGGTVETRVAYQELSRIIRGFVYEVTRIEVHHYGFSEISALNMPQLTELVREYYEPEFSKEAPGDILASLYRTRQVMSVWR